MLAHLIPLLISFSCANFNEGYPVSSDDVQPFEQKDGENSGGYYFAEDPFELISETRCTNPCSFSAQASDIVTVRYWADEWEIGSSDSLEMNYRVAYFFQTTGRRLIKAEGLDAYGNVIASDQLNVIVENNAVDLITPTECVNPCSFETEASGDVTRVEYHAEDWFLGATSNSEDNHFIEVEFYELGQRNITVVGFDKNGERVATDSRWVDIKSSSSNNPVDVPYYYQYANEYNPGGSCQNTSIAMLISHYGQALVPDEISYAWGTSYAQTPAGLSDLFNHYAAQSGIQQRLTPIMQGTLDGMRAELDRGNPVIIHGYFTSYGHVLMVVGYDDDGYWVNDPAGKWSETFKGGYPYGWNSTVGKAIHYDRYAFEQAVATSNGSSYLPLWYHLVR